MLKPLDTQVMVITGASSGIGLVTARKAAARGAQVMLIARNAEALREAVRSITAAGGVADWAAADVGDLSAVEGAAAKTIERFGRIDTWVNNAGVAIYAKLTAVPEREHAQLFRTNYFGAVHGALTAIHHMREKGGALITVGSIASDIPSPLMGAYAASKHAVKGYIDSLRIELNADAVPISVSLIKPSGISTPIAAHAANHVDGEARIPPPVYDPELVADAILDAAERPVREVTVGGVGRLQALLSVHFPGLLARWGGAMMPLLSDPDSKRTATDNLAGPAKDLEERSSVQPGRRISVYSAVGRHPGASLVAASVVAAGTIAWFVRARGAAARS